MCDNGSILACQDLRLYFVLWTHLDYLGPSLSWLYGLLMPLCQTVLLMCPPFMVWKTYIILFYFLHMSHLLLIFIIMIYEHNNSVLCLPHVHCSFGLSVCPFY